MSFDVTLDDRVFQRLIAKLNREQNKVVHVGILQSKNAAAKHDNSDSSIVAIAAAHEFGAPKANIPERSFIRRTFITREADAKKMLGRLVNGLVDGRVEVNNGLRLLGAWGVAAVKNTITASSILPRLKPATVKRKGSEHTLVDTGQLINSIHFEVARK